MEKSLIRFSVACILMGTMIFTPQFSYAYCISGTLEREFNGSTQVILVKTVKEKPGVPGENGIYRIIAEYKVLKTYKGDHIEKFEYPTSTQYGPAEGPYEQFIFTTGTYPGSGGENGINVFFGAKRQRINNDGSPGNQEMDISPCYQVYFAVKDSKVFEPVETFKDFINVISKEPEYKEKFKKTLSELEELSKNERKRKGQSQKGAEGS